MSRRAPITITTAMADPNLFGPWFKDPATWTAWLAFLKCLFVLPLSDAELAWISTEPDSANNAKRQEIHPTQESRAYH